MKPILFFLFSLISIMNGQAQDYTIVSVGDNKYAIDINKLDSLLFVKEEESIPRLSHDTVYQDRILWVHDTIFVNGNVKTFKAGSSPSPQIASLDRMGLKRKTAENRNGKELSIVTIGQDSYVIDTELLEDNDIVPIKRYNKKEYRDTTYKSRNVWVHDTVYIDLKNSYSINGVYYPMPEAVDLGLPSGTLWASCNLGASDHLEKGGFFAWGETAPKNEYNYMNYAFSMPSQVNAFKERIEAITIEDDNGNEYLRSPLYSKYYKYRKWVWNDEYRRDELTPIYTDNLTELQDEDNAVKTILGGEWDIPTAEQARELVDNTTHELIELREEEIYPDEFNGRRLMKFTGKNGNCIYLRLPGTIQASQASVDGKGWMSCEEEDGSYWTKDFTLDMGSTIQGAYCSIDGFYGDRYIDFWVMKPELFKYRPFGHTIRPVKNPTKK